MKVKIKVLEHGKGLPIPKKATELSACVDLYAAIGSNVTLFEGETKLIPCGFCIEVPVGYEAQIRSRSGNALKKNMTVQNSPGTIDADYRGEVGVILHNANIVPHLSLLICRGDRIAQMTIKKVEDFELEEVEELSSTERGSGGFGSTGK